MSAPDVPSHHDAASSRAADLAYLASLGPEAQGDIDNSVLRDNLALTPLARLQAASDAATQVELLQRAVAAARHA